MESVDFITQVTYSSGIPRTDIIQNGGILYHPSAIKDYNPQAHDPGGQYIHYEANKTNASPSIYFLGVAANTNHQS
jgi:hypothetical protein